MSFCLQKNNECTECSEKKLNVLYKITCSNFSSTTNL